MIKEVQNAMQSQRKLSKSRLGGLEKDFQGEKASNLKSEGANVIS